MSTNKLSSANSAAAAQTNQCLWEWCAQFSRIFFGFTSKFPRKYFFMFDATRAQLCAARARICRHDVVDDCHQTMNPRRPTLIRRLDSCSCKTATRRSSNVGRRLSCCQLPPLLQPLPLVTAPILVQLNTFILLLALWLYQHWPGCSIAVRYLTRPH